MTASTSQAAPIGIGGWLLLVAVGVCLTPVRMAVEIIRGLRPLEPTTWHAVTTPGTRAYHPLFGPLIVGELVVNAALLIWAGVLVYLFFTRQRSFPVAMITYMIARVVAQAADTGAALMIPVAAATMGPAAYGDLAMGVLTTVIWVPYLIRSRRVELTFVR
ncbi:MAG TPA: DUF2569 domain-containing protein [Methylomirabilota bacterium]